MSAGGNSLNDIKDNLDCAGHFEGEPSSENYRRCGKPAVVVFELAGTGPINYEGKAYVAKNTFVGACEEHEANRRSSYEHDATWKIVRAIPASEARGA